MRLKNIVIILFVVTLMLRSGFASAVTVRSDHPRIHVTTDSNSSDGLASLRSRLAGSDRSRYLAVKARGDVWATVPVNGVSYARDEFQIMELLAFLYMVGEIPGVTYTPINGVPATTAYGTKALEYAMYYANYFQTTVWYEQYYAQWTSGLSHAYDWLFPLMTPLQREAIVKACINLIDSALNPSSGSYLYRAWDGTNYAIGPRTFIMAPLAWSGDTAYIGTGDNPTYQQKADYYIGLFDRYWRDGTLGIMNWMGVKGGWHEGVFYGKTSVMFDAARMLDAWRTSTGEDLLSSSGLYRYNALWVYQNTDRAHRPVSVANYPYSPSGWYLKVGDIRFDQWHTNNPLEDKHIYGVNRLTAKIFKDIDPEMSSFSQWFAEEIERSYPPLLSADTDLQYHILGLIWGTDQVAARSPTQLNLPLTTYFGKWEDNINSPFYNHAIGLGQVVMRSGWDNGATIASYIHEPFPTSTHDHQTGQGSFLINRKGWLALDSGGYEDGDGADHENNYAWKTIAHNALAIYNPQEVFWLPGSPSNSVNDGGQRTFNSPNTLGDKGGYFDPKVRTPYGSWHYMTIGSTWDTGGIRWMEDDSRYTYIYDNLTRAYQSTEYSVDTYFGSTTIPAATNQKVSLVTREFVQVKTVPNKQIFVVFDRVNETDSNFARVIDPAKYYPETSKKKWLLHSTNEPSISGSLLSSGNCYSVYDGRRIAVTNDQGQLYAESIFPENVHLVKRGGSQSSGCMFNDIEGVDHPKSSYGTGWQPEYGAWRIEVSPTGQNLTKDNIFLNILHPLDISDPSGMGVSVRISQAEGNVDNPKLVGLHYLGGQRNFTILFSKVPKDYPTGMFSCQVEGTASSSLMVFTLEPGQTYYYSVEKVGTGNFIKIYVSKNINDVTVANPLATGSNISNESGSLVIPSIPSIGSIPIEYPPGIGTKKAQVPTSIYVQ